MHILIRFQSQKDIKLSTGQKSLWLLLCFWQNSCYYSATVGSRCYCPKENVCFVISKVKTLSQPLSSNFELSFKPTCASKYAWYAWYTVSGITLWRHSVNSTLTGQQLCCRIFKVLKTITVVKCVNAERHTWSFGLWHTSCRVGCVGACLLHEACDIDD